MKPLGIRRRHDRSLSHLSGRASGLLALACALATIPLMGADCLGTTPPPGTARADCEAVCAAEDQCHQADATVARGKAECLTALCTDTGFKVVDTGANASDLASLTSNDCEKAATDCAALLLCSCPDSCARVTQCTGDANATCTDDCDNLIPSDPALYVENRCKMEATCADLAACGSAE